MLLSRKVIEAFLLILVLPFCLVLAQETVGGRLIKKGSWKNRQIEYVDRQIVVRIKFDVRMQDVKAVIGKHNGKLVEGIDIHRWGLIELPEGADIFQVIEALKDNPTIEVAEPNEPQT